MIMIQALDYVVKLVQLPAVCVQKADEQVYRYAKTTILFNAVTADAVYV